MSGSARILQAFISLGGAVLTVLAAAVVVELWAGAPPADVAMVKQVFWQSHPLPETWQGMAAVWSMYGLTMLMNVWPLSFVLLAGVLLTAMALRRYGNEESGAYLERMHMLESGTEDARRQIEEYQTQWEALNTALDTVFDRSGELWVVVGPEGRIRRWNQPALEFARQRQPALETLEGQRMADIWGTAENSPQRAATEALRGQPWHGEVRIDQAHYLGWAWPLGNDAAVLLRDISGLYKPESSLRTSEALVRQLVEDSTRPVAVVDAQWKYLYVSRRWPEFFQLGESVSLVGKAHPQVVEGFPPNLAQLSQQLATGKAVSKEEEMVKVGEREETVSWTVRPWRDSDNRLGGYIFNVSPVTELARLRAQVKQGQERENQLAYSDSLTGLPNRQLFNDRLNMALALAYRQLSKVALMFIDLDGFKGVNDTLGHEHGDMLLKQVAERLKKATRDTDTVARLGGDEFTIILGVREKGDAEQVAQKVIQMLAEPFDLAGQAATIGGSVGIAMYPADGETAAALIRKADAAMYEAKNAGKNTYRFSGTEIVIEG